MTVTINPNTPPDTGESPGLGSAQIRGIKQAILDLFGLPASTPIPTPIGGQRVGPFTNRTGVELQINDMVTFDLANDTSVVLDDTTGSPRTFVVTTAVTPNNDPGTFGQSGEFTVHTFGAVTRGHYLRKSATGGALEDSAVAQPAPAPPGALGIALTGTVSAGHSSVTALLWGVTMNTGGIANPSVYGMDPNASAATNRAALQAAIDAMPSTGGILQFTKYGYHINAVINVTKPLTILGPGLTEVSTPGIFVLYLDTASQVGFNVTAKGPFVMQRMSISGATSSTHIVINGPTGSLKGTVDARVEDCVFNAGAIHLDCQASIFQRVTRCTFWNYTSAGCKIQNLLDGDQGDSLIADSVFSGPQSVNVFGVLYLSGGGLKIVNNKFLGNGAGIAVDPTTTATDPATISDLIIANNSIEGFNNRGIFFTRTSGALVPSQIHIVNNQIAKTTGAGTVGIEVTPAGAAGSAYIGMIIEGNYISQALTVAINLDKVSGVMIAGNVYAIPGGTIYGVTSAVLNLTIDVNNDLDYTTFMSGTPGTNSFLKGGLLPVAQLPPVARGWCYVFDALGPGEVGYTAGNAVTGGGNGAIAWVRFGTGWRA